MKAKRGDSDERRGRSVFVKTLFAVLTVAALSYWANATFVFYARKATRETAKPAEPLQSLGLAKPLEPLQSLESAKPLESAERKAFLVAADDYGSKASALPGAKRDVEALRARLLEIGFEERNIVTLQTARTDSGAIDFDLLPQKAKIEERFKAFVDDLKPGDLAFVFLSGHGIEAPRTNEAFFVPIDFDPDDPLATSVSVDAMTAALAKSGATFRWFAVDACRSKPSAPSRTLFASRSTDAAPLSEIANVPASVVMLQSCRSGQSSYEGGLGKAKNISNGFFALSLLEALDPKESKADENKDGVASFLEICRYVATRTSALAQTYYKREQEPTLSGADITDFPFLTGLLVDGLPYDDWKRMNDAFEAAKASRREGEYEAALDKLALALQIAPENEACRAEETELRQLVDAANRLASANDSPRELGTGKIANEPRELSEARIAIEPPERVFVLIVGVSEYADEIADLPYADADAELLAETFAKLGVPAENIVKLTSDAKDVRFRSTKTNIIRWLAELETKTQPGDFIFLSLAGHSVETVAGDDAYFLPLDAQASAILEGNDFGSSISQTELRESLEKLDERSVCYLNNGCPGFFGGLANVGWFCEFDAFKWNEEPFGFEELGHGAFTWAFVEGMSERADANDDDVVTFAELGSYVRNRTLKATSGRQTPNFSFWRNSESDAVLIRTLRAGPRALEATRIYGGK